MRAESMVSYLRESEKRQKDGRPGTPKGIRVVIAMMMLTKGTGLNSILEDAAAGIVVRFNMPAVATRIITNWQTLKKEWKAIERM
jgi:hypothetical protein